MLRNKDMKRGRFLKLFEGKKLLSFIQTALRADKVIMISTYTRHVQYDKRHVDAFKMTKDGDVLVRRGKHWDQISGGGCGIKSYIKAKK